MIPAITLPSTTPIFAIDTRTYCDTAKTIMLFVLKIVIFPWGLYEMAKYATQRILMAFIYPAQSTFFQHPERTKVELVAQQILGKDTVIPILLEKNGVQFSGWMISDPAERNNGQWVLQACGNGERAEDYLLLIGKQYSDVHFNTILVNNPGVGSSQGTSTPFTIGETQELAIQFLETKMKAHKIALAGRSLGGAAIGQAILQHEFKPQIQYLVFQQMTFGSLSHIAKKIVKEIAPWLKSIVEPLIRWTNLEMNTLDASRKLAECHIPEIIINRRDALGRYYDDGVIPAKATLGARLEKTNISKQFKRINHGNTDYYHNDPASIAFTAATLSNWNLVSINQV